MLAACHAVAGDAGKWPGVRITASSSRHIPLDGAVWRLQIQVQRIGCTT